MNPTTDEMLMMRPLPRARICGRTAFVMRMTPALVAMYRVTANVLRVKSAWRFTLTHNTSLSEAAAALWADIDAHTVELLARAQREGLLASATDLDWMRQVYYALLSEALNMGGTDQNSPAEDPDALAELVIDTLLHGGGPHD
jgi:hypothetical protein